LFGSPAAADPIEIEITSGQTSRPVNHNIGAFLNLFGDQFSLTAALFSGQRFTPNPPYLPGTTIAVDARWSGTDAPGSFTYQGQTVTLGTPPGPSLVIEFLSDPFVVPPLNGSPVADVPFTLTGGIFNANIQAFDLHGSGSMMFTFAFPITETPPIPRWDSGTAQFVVTTPEPSAIVLVATALGGLGVGAWRRLRFRRSV